MNLWLVRFLLIVSMIMLALCYPSLALADDNIDKLKQQLLKSSANDKATVLMQLLDAYRNSDPKLALSYGEKALALLDTFPDAKTKVAVLNEMSWSWRLLGQYDKALQSVTQAVKLAKGTDDLTGYGRALNNIGVIYWSLGDYDKVLDYWLKALAIRSDAKDQNAIAGSLNNIGLVYFHQNDNDSAIIYFNQALQISQQTGNQEYLVNHLDNLGEVYIKQQHFAQAETVLEQARAIAKQQSNNKGHISTLINLGRLMLQKNELAEAENLLMQANALAQQTGITAKEIESTQHLALLAFKRQQYNQALALAQMALSEAEQLTDKQLLSDSYLQLVDINEAQQDYQAALEASKHYNRINAQLIDQAKQGKITSLQMQFKTRQQEKQIALLTAENKLRALKLVHNENTSLILQVSIITLSVFTLLLIWGYKTKSTANKIINEQYRQLDMTRQELYKQATTDPLTLLLNRRALHERLEDEVARANRGQSTFCVCLMDIDHFKQVNDNYGHCFGDHVLKAVADLISTTVRRQDAVARWGGEEFLILLTDTELDCGKLTLQRLCDAISAKQFSLHGTTVRITATIGLSIYQPNATAINDVMTAADHALYEGKNTGRNQVIIKDIR